jgi:hypothetical protein
MFFPSLGVVWRITRPAAAPKRVLQTEQFHKKPPIVLNNQSMTKAYGALAKLRRSRKSHGFNGKWRAESSFPTLKQAMISPGDFPWRSSPELGPEWHV